MGSFNLQSEIYILKFFSILWWDPMEFSAPISASVLSSSLRNSGTRWTRS